MAKIINPNVGGKFLPLSKTQILEAQKHTKSNAAAARYLNASYNRYKRYATIYNLFDSHTNQKGIGVAKGYSKRPSTVALKDIFANKHPKYNPVRLKHRLVARKILEEKCCMCGFNERRLTDRKTPLLLTFIDGSRNYELSNLQLMCYNCIFLTTGAPSIANRGMIVKSFERPDRIPDEWQVNPREVDSIDVGEPDVAPDDSLGLDSIKDSILDELGR